MFLRIRIYFSAVCLLILAGCSGYKNASSTKKSNNRIKTTHPKDFPTTSNETGTITFNEGENKFLEEYQMNVNFKEITEDSRCPEGVNCIWEGAATAEIEFMGMYTRTIKTHLSTTNNIRKNLTNHFTFNNYKISLVKVSPYPTNETNKEKLKGRYQITLQFEKLTENEIQNNNR